MRARRARGAADDKDAARVARGADIMRMRAGKSAMQSRTAAAAARMREPRRAPLARHACYDARFSRRDAPCLSDLFASADARYMSYFSSARMCVYDACYAKRRAVIF